MRTRRQWIVLGLAAGLGCNGGAKDGDGQAGIRVPVGTATVVRDTMPLEVEVIGTLRPSPGHAALLTAPVAGLVRATMVQAGDRVTAGTLLIRLDAPELAAAAQSGELAAQVAEQDARRQQGLLDEGVTARRTVEEKQALARSARADATSSAAQLARASVRSPIAGEVQRVLVQPGERVDAGAALVEVVDRRSLDLVGAVPAASMAMIQPGQLVAVTAEGFPDPFPGRVHAVPPALDSASHSGQVIIRITNTGHLPAGLGARGIVRVGLLREALIVPDSALVIVGDAQTLFVVGADSVAHARPVVIVARRAGRVAVQGELQPGASVVTAGAWGLADGMKVAPASGSAAP
jgi:membrane fusion protein, multidrug efflux system